MKVVHLLRAYRDSADRYASAEAMLDDMLNDFYLWGNPELTRDRLERFTKTCYRRKK